MHRVDWPLLGRLRQKVLPADKAAALGNRLLEPRVSPPVLNLLRSTDVSRSNRRITRKLLVIFASLALFATACGGGGGQSSEAASAAEAAASTNEATLALTGDLASTQLLDTTDGGIADLGDIVTGDRPVLLWYWAPH